jgi:hypothetical protein
MKERIDMTNPEAPNKKPRCQFITKNGSRCHADPQVGNDWCFFHDPEQKKKQAEARKQGGEVRARQTAPEITLPPNLPVMRLEKASDLLELFAQTINHLRQGEMDLRATKAIGYLAGLLLRALNANARPVATLLADTINQFRCGQVDLPTAKTIGHLASLMLSAMKQALLEEQAASGAQAAQPAQVARAGAPRQDRNETVITPTVAAKPPNDAEPHPAVINGAANANKAFHTLSS